MQAQLPGRREDGRMEVCCFPSGFLLPGVACMCDGTQVKIPNPYSLPEHELCCQPTCGNLGGHNSPHLLPQPPSKRELCVQSSRQLYSLTTLTHSCLPGGNLQPPFCYHHASSAKIQPVADICACLFGKAAFVWFCFNANALGFSAAK